MWHGRDTATNEQEEAHLAKLADKLDETLYLTEEALEILTKSIVQEN